MSNWQALQNAAYVNIATFRKSGVAVATPIWAAPQGDALYAFSAADAGKIKRLRNNATARLAICDVRGKLLGEWQDVQAHVIDQPADIDTALQALASKYGWKMRLTNLMSQLTGKYHKRAYLRISQAS